MLCCIVKPIRISEGRLLADYCGVVSRVLQHASASKDSEPCELGWPPRKTDLPANAPVRAAPGATLLAYRYAH